MTYSQRDLSSPSYNTETFLSPAFYAESNAPTQADSTEVTTPFFSDKSSKSRRKEAADHIKETEYSELLKSQNLESPNKKTRRSIPTQQPQPNKEVSNYMFLKEINEIKEDMKSFKSKTEQSFMQVSKMLEVLDQKIEHNGRKIDTCMFEISTLLNISKETNKTVNEILKFLLKQH